MQQLIPIFLTGLLTGGVTCMAVQGGLLAAVVASRQDTADKSKKRHIFFITAVFLSAKLAAYTLLGFLLGFVGSFFQFSPMTMVILQVAATLFMLGVAGNLLNIHPIFRYTLIQPPRVFGKIARSSSKSGTWFAPALVGALTIFLPCGTTQAMMVQSVSSGNPVTGALILFAFILGTAPVFFLLGLVLHTTMTAFTSVFTKIAAILIILLSIWNIGNIATLLGVHPQTVLRRVVCEITYCENQEDSKSSSAGFQVTTHPTITIESSSYDIDNQNIPAGEQITLTITNKRGGGCIQAFTIPKLNIFQIVPVGESRTITFTAPKEKGTLVYSCSMGMYRGAFTVK